MTITLDAHTIDLILGRLSRSQRRQLGDIEEQRLWAWEARQDAAHERALVAGRYFLLGALDIDLPNDDHLRAVLAAAFEA